MLSALLSKLLPEQSGLSPKGGADRNGARNRVTGLVADLGDPSARLEWPAWALAKDPKVLAQGLVVIWVELPGSMGGSRMGLVPEPSTIP